MKFLKYMMIALWFVGTSYLFSHLHALHMVDHTPKESKPLLSPIEIYLDNKNWNMVHYFDLKCGCSKTAINQLLNRGPQKHQDVFVIINNTKEMTENILSQGFKNVVTWDDSTEKLFIEGVPLLTIYAPEKKLLYSGGYRYGSITPLHSLEDMKILSRLQNEKENIKRYPASGCHVSQEYQKIIDPLGVKYDKN